jgi:DnaK suppressor protein
MTLNRRELIELSGAIRERRSALLDEIRLGVARARADSHEAIAGGAPDRAEEALADVVADLDLAEVTRDFGELQELEAAARRLTDGSYGVCLDCGGDIPVERLRVRPGAPRCLDCQRLHEKTYRATV